jgi:Peptidase A4 family
MSRSVLCKGSVPRNFPHSEGANLTAFLLASAMAVAVFLLSPLASAQTSAHGHWVYDPKGIATPGFVYDLPPAGFNPLTASDLELEQWGFPPRPNSSNVKAYAHWKRAAGATHVVPQLIFTNIYNGPAKNVRTITTTSTNTAANSDNWSGTVITQPNGTFSADLSDVQGEWTVPAVLPAPGRSCSSATYASSQWVGFDGWISSDVLQAGTQVNCGTSAFFWYEWYPFAETQISLGVVAGDSVSSDVWYTTTSPYGHAQLENFITGQIADVAFNPPSGTTYEGNSAEWVMERPTVNGALADLPNFNFAYLGGNAGYCEGDQICGPTLPPTKGGALYQVNMTCPPWNPSSSCTATTTIVYSYAVGDDTLAVYTEPPVR